MGRILTAAALTLAAVPGHAQVVQEMTPERIREAIADRKTEGCYELKKSYACFTTPYSRVVQAARAAAKEYKRFGEADVTEAMVAPVVEVLAYGQLAMVMGSGRVGSPVDVKTVVVLPRKSKDPGDVIHAMERIEVGSTWDSGLDGKFEGKGMLAVFPLSVLTEANEVRLVYNGDGCSDWKLNPAKECDFRFRLKGVR
jgi:hypothetical protein